jgi:hypothetical protein
VRPLGALLSVFLCLSVGVGTARASSLSDELSLSRSTPTPDSPSAGQLTNNLFGDYDVNRTWVLTARLSLTRNQSPPTQSGAFAESGGNVLQLAVGAEVNLSRKLILGWSLNGSPASTSYTNTQVDVTTQGQAKLIADAQLRSVASSQGAMFTLTYDTFGEPDLDLGTDPTGAGLEDLEWPRFETNVSLMAGVTHFGSTQKITQLVAPDGTLLADSPTSDCNTESTALRRVLCNRLEKANGESLSILQFPISLAVQETIYEDTDVGLVGTYFAYNQDPERAGFFTVATEGRDTVAFGAGVPLAPVEFSVRPELAHWFGSHVYVALDYEYGRYIDNEGYSNAVTLKLKVRFNKHWRAWVTLVGDQDVDSVGEMLPSGQVAFGLRYTF